VQSLHDAIRALQFEDMATQNIQYHIETLRLLEPLAKSMVACPADMEEISRQINAEIDQINLKIEQRRHNPVSAGSMESGDIDLF
jgi:methyl-accepting chemotaxis protein